MFYNMQWSLILCFVIFSIIDTKNVIANENAPVIITSVGSIRGVRASDGDYSMFLGIPYAKLNPSNPFGVATPYPNFDGVFEANDDTKSCPQIEEFNNTIIGSPDCMNLNVFVPNSASVGNPTAVLVWIYGGGFSQGFAAKFIHGPKYIVRQNVILVTLNYRLGPYGFTCLHTPEIPGNQGLRDQLFALRWIQKNIAAFGGDPERVTVFGNSAGAVAIDLHARSEQEELFNGIILESGTAFLGQWRTEPNTGDFLELAKVLGLTTTNINEAFNFLAGLNSDTVIEAASKISAWFSPCIEKQIDGIDRILTENPVNLGIPKAKRLNVMMGYNNDEQMIRLAFAPPESYPLFQNDFRDYLRGTFDFDDSTLAVAERMFRNFYVGDDDFNQDMIYDLANFHSDNAYVYPTERNIIKYVENGADVYNYVFSYNGGRNLLKRRLGLEIGGAYHADEVSYLFDVQLFPEEPLPEDQLMIDRMTTLWANFAKYGNPTPEQTPLLPVKWEPITKDSPHHYLNITYDIAAGRRPFHQRMTFWELFFQAYGTYERTLQSQSSAAANLNSPLYFVIGLIIVKIVN